MSWLARTAGEETEQQLGLVALSSPQGRLLAPGTPVAEMVRHGYWRCECGHVEPMGVSREVRFCDCGRKMVWQSGIEG